MPPLLMCASRTQETYLSVKTSTRVHSLFLLERVHARSALTCPTLGHLISLPRSAVAGYTVVVIGPNGRDCGGKVWPRPHSQLVEVATPGPPVRRVLIQRRDVLKVLTRACSHP